MSGPAVSNAWVWLGAKGGLGKKGLISASLAAAVIAAPVHAAEEIRGQADVISGNEIVIGKKTVRLFGIAAPGLKDVCKISGVSIKCGVIAWAGLIELADGRAISCDREELPDGAAKPEKPTIYATCYIGETDVNEALVRSGWAHAVPEQTDRYEVDETDAKESGRGLWAGRGKRRR